MQSEDKKTGMIMPAFYISFISLGLILFVLVAQSVKIPVYRTFDVSVEKEAGKTYIYFNEKVPVTNAKIYLYVARDENVTGIEEYRYSQTCDAIVLDGEYFENDAKLFADVQISELSLLGYILKGKAE